MATSSIKCLGLPAIPVDSHLIVDAAVVSSIDDEACQELITVALACAAAGSEVRQRKKVFRTRTFVQSRRSVLLTFFCWCARAACCGGCT